MRLDEAECVLVGMVVYKRHCSCRSDKFSRVNSLHVFELDFILLSCNAFFKTNFIGVMALAACCIIYFCILLFLLALNS